MNATLQNLCRTTTTALAAAVLLSPAAASANGLDDLWWLVDPIEGLWDAKVTITNCANGSPTPISFDALGLFARGGAFHNADALNPLAPAMRSASFGTWKRLSARSYEFTFKLFRFDPTGAPLGTQVVWHTLTLARDGKTYTSSGASQAYDVNGNPLSAPPTGCSISTAKRFE
jgi:hypothetical protein